MSSPKLLSKSKTIFRNQHFLNALTSAITQTSHKIMKVIKQFKHVCSNQEFKVTLERQDEVSIVRIHATDLTSFDEHESVLTDYQLHHLYQQQGQAQMVTFFPKVQSVYDFMHKKVDQVDFSQSSIKLHPQILADTARNVTFSVELEKIEQSQNQKLAKQILEMTRKQQDMSKKIDYVKLLRLKKSSPTTEKRDKPQNSWPAKGLIIGILGLIFIMEYFLSVGLYAAGTIGAFYAFILWRNDDPQPPKPNLKINDQYIKHSYAKQLKAKQIRINESKIWAEVTLTEQKFSGNIYIPSMHVHSSVRYSVQLQNVEEQLCLGIGPRSLVANTIINRKESKIINFDLNVNSKKEGALNSRIYQPVDLLLRSIIEFEVDFEAGYVFLWVDGRLVTFTTIPESMLSQELYFYVRLADKGDKVIVSAE